MYQTCSENKKSLSIKTLLVILTSCVSIPAFSIELQCSPSKNYTNTSRTGTFAIAPTYDFATYFEDGTAFVRVRGKWGIIDLTGSFIVEPQFEGLLTFSEGLAAAKVGGENGKWGYIDTSGKFQINPIFIEASPFLNGSAGVRTDMNNFFYIDKYGKKTERQWPKLPASSSYIQYYDEKSKLYGLRNYGGGDNSIIINPQFDRVGDFDKCSGLLNVRIGDDKTGRWGFVNIKGEFIINPKFLDSHSFTDGLASVKIYFNGKELWGFIDVNGKIVIEPIFEDAGYFIESLAAVLYNGKIGFIDKRGRFIIQPQFDKEGNLRPFENGLAPVMLNGKAGFIHR